MDMEEGNRDTVVGTIEHTRKLLSFLETLTDPSETAEGLIRQYRAEVAAYEYEQRPAPSEFHDVAGANV